MNPHTAAFWLLVLIAAALYLWHFASEVHRARQDRTQATWDAHWQTIPRDPIGTTLAAEYAADGRDVGFDWAAAEAEMGGAS